MFFCELVEKMEDIPSFEKGNLKISTMTVKWLTSLSPSQTTRVRFLDPKNFLLIKLNKFFIN